jgi:hypothetical protein
LSQLDRRGALRLFASLGAAGVAAPLLSACGDSGSTNETASKGTVKIGLLVPQSGPNKAIGDDMKQGFELFRTLGSGRLGGYDVEQVLADEGETAESGKAAVEKLVKQDKVLAVTGVATSAVMLAIKDTTVGASGGVFGLLLAFGMAYPRRELIIFPIPVPIQAWLAVTLYGAMELFLGVTRTASGIAHFAHLGGMATGFVLIRYWHSQRRRPPPRG